MSELKIMSLTEERLLKYVFQNKIEGKTFQIIGYSVSEFERDGEKIPYATVEVALADEWKALSEIGYEDNAGRMDWSVRGFDGSDLSSVVGKVLTVSDYGTWTFKKEFVSNYGRKESRIVALKNTVSLEELLAL